MKLADFTVLFLIIIIPVMLLLSYFLSLQTDTIGMQTEYHSKQLDASKDAIDAFEINTVEWNSAYSTVANSKRRDVMASINTFTTSFSNSIGIAGISKQELLAYIPAIAVTLYDGYYIYTPAETKQIVKNENGIAVFMNEGIKTRINKKYKDEDKGKILYLANDGYEEGIYTYEKTDGTEVSQKYTLDPNKAKTEYAHILKPYATYSARYVKEDEKIDIVVNYTLDNYITIYGTVNGNYVIKSGYLIDTASTEKITEPENLKELVWYDGLGNTPKEFTYIYASDNTKVYFDGATLFQVDANNKKTNLSEKSAMYKEIVLSNGTSVYQALNNGAITSGKNVVQNQLYTDDKNGIEYTAMVAIPSLNQDVSARNYYYKSIEFSKWVYSKLKNITTNNMQDRKELEYNLGEGTITEKITDYGDPIFSKDAQSEDSVFAKHKAEVIRQILVSDLNQAITSYSRNSKGNYELPVMTEDDWNQILRNVSMITFVQNMPIGMKYYNDYVVATSTANKEYVNPDEIYLISNDSGSDNNSTRYYHKPYCDKLVGTQLIGYRNIDFVAQKFSIGDDEIYYFKHIYNNVPKQACYYCIVQRELFSSGGLSDSKLESHKKAYNYALARERYAMHNFR